MRNMFLFGLLAVAFIAFGCSSNPAGSSNNITGPAAAGALSLAPVPNSPPSETPEATPGFYGEVSNLNLGAGTFTLASPSGSTRDVVATPGAKVLYQGKFYDLASSPLADGMNVSITSAVSGLPERAKIRATLIVINSSPTNQALVNPD